MVLLLSDADVAKAISMAEAVEQLDAAFRQHAMGRTIVPPRTSATIPREGGLFRVMSAILPEEGFFGLKTLTGYPGRRAKHETYFVVLLFAASDGALRAIIGANRLTGIRTGAATALASKYLGRGDSRVAGLFGAGVQGWYQIAALKEVHPLREVRIFDPDASKVSDFAARASEELGLRAITVTDARDAVAGCDLVITATAASSPVFNGAWLEEGTHVSGVGSNAPAKCELDGLTFKRSTLVVDFREQVLQEAGDLQAAIKAGDKEAASIHADLGEIVTGSKHGRSSDSEITLFKSVGMAIEDVVTAAYIYRKALAAGLGSEIVLDDDVVMPAIHPATT